MPSPRLDVDRVVAALVLLAIALLLVPPFLAQGLGVGAGRAWDLVAAALLAGVVVLLLAVALRGGRVAVPIRLLYAVVLGGLLLLPVVAETPYPAYPGPWLTNALPTLCAAVPAGFRAWWSAGLAVAALIGASVWLVVSQTWLVPTSGLLLHALFFAVTGTIGFATISTLYASQANLARLYDKAVRRHVTARAIERVSRASTRWDSFVHDEVLAGLAVIADGDPDAAREAAASVLRHLSHGPGGATAGSDASEACADPGGLAEEILDVALAVYPLASTHLSVAPDACPLPEPVREAVALATAEALRNVATHAYPDGPGPAAVTLQHDSDGVEVVVSDDGVGYRRADIRSTALGIAISIEARMAAVGGLGVVETSPGRGTTVRLRWSPPRR